MPTRRAAAGLVAATLLAGACSGGDDRTSSPSLGETSSAETPAGAAGTTVPPTAETVVGGSIDQPIEESVEQSLDETVEEFVGPVAEPVRNPLSSRPIYFVIPDRFDNGDPTNDTGGIAGGPLDHGFLPEDRGFHHGGDLAGLTTRLPYLDDLGIGAIWITPPFTNRVVQGDGTIEGSSSSYHGYWQVDWDRVDPHLGTDADLRAFVDAAHRLDIAVYLDIVVNHTGDVITYAEDSFAYVGSGSAPYLDASGEAFDPAAVAGSDDFPDLDATISFPYTPVFASESDATAKSPDWLNDPTLYHNRGNSTFNGESDTWGDFFGLDDLFTEHPRVVEGMIELYGGIIERFDVDGFRVDTMKHVNPEFWAAFAPAIRRRAADLGKPDFVLIGEVFNQDPIQQSAFTNLGVTSTLDFVVNQALHGYVAEGGPGAFLAQALDDDDWFTDEDGNASMQATFFGNHDEGRMGYAIEVANPGAADAVLLDRMRLGNDLLFLMRGAPIVYYGDEQGFTGDGGDQLARQDMFPSSTPEYLDDESIGVAGSPGDDNFDPGHPLYRHIAELTALRAAHPTLVDGAQYVHPTDGAVFAFSRIDRNERREYVIVTNSSAADPGSARLDVLSADTGFEVLRGPTTGAISSTPDGDLVVEVPPLSTVVLRAVTPIEPPAEPPTVEIVRPAPGATIVTTRTRIEAALGDRRPAEVTFAVAAGVSGEPRVLGVDDAPPYRLYWNTSEFSTGTEVDLIVTVDDGSGRHRSDVVAVVVGERP